MKKIFIVVVFLSFSCISRIQAQDPNSSWDKHQFNQLEISYPQSPEAAAFNKFVNIPQGNYTGIHGYSVPIYTMEGKGFSLPISIDYHGMGVNVNEIASAVGLGWNLNVGGLSLTQEVRGYDDFNGAKDVTEINDPRDFFEANVQSGEPFYLAAIKVAGGYDFVMTGSEQESPYEVNPDYFSYSLLNNSGKFIKDRNSNFHTIPKDEIHIQLIANQGFVLTDKKGIKYYFSRFKHSENKSEAYRVNETFQYKLDSVFFPDSQQTMYFTYESVSYKYMSNYQNSINLYTSIEDAGNSTPLISEVSKSKTKTEVFADYLMKTITYNNIKVEFNYIGESEYNNGRKDVNGGKKLSSIKVYNIVNPSSPILTNDFKLNTSYFESSGYIATGLIDSEYPMRTFYSRLKLNSIEDILNGTKFEFAYNEDKQLPPRFSPYTDWWGSYTKPKTNSNSYLPSYIHKENLNGEIKYFEGANKEPDIEYAITGSLKKVHFPTGGYQQFEYELDEYKYDSVQTKMEPLFFNTDSWSSDNPNTRLYLPVSDPDFRKGFDYRLTFATDHENCNFDPPNGIPEGYFFKFYLYRDNGNGTDTIMWGEQIIDGNLVYQIPESIFDNNPNSDFYLTIETFGSPTPQCPAPGNPTIFTPQINYMQEYDPVYVKNKNTGHLRVKSISLFNENDQLQIKRSFKYKDFSDPQREFSSGIFQGIPYTKKLIVKRFHHSEDPPEGSGNCNMGQAYSAVSEVISSNPSLNLNSSYGKSVFYDNVTEVYENIENSSKNYFKDLIFKVPSKDGYSDYINPVTYWPHNEYTGGQLLEERLYNENYNPANPQTGLVKVIKNEYSEPDPHFNSESSYYHSDMPNYIGFGLAAAVVKNNLNIVAGNCIYDYEHKTNFYNITSGWVKLLYSEQKDYENGQLIMTNKTEYEYDNTYSHLNPVSTITTNSLGEEVKTVYAYEHPYKKDEPTTTVQYQKGSPTSVQKTTFYSNGLPQYVFAKKGAATLDDTIPSDDLMVRYESFDSYGNLTQFRYENGTPVSIIWGYNGQYPIAKVEGISYQEIQNHVGTIISKSNQDDDNCTGTNNECNEAQLRKALNDFRSLSIFNGPTAKNVLITSYTYDPLIGVTSITQPNRQIEYYQYDNAGRLKLIMDQNGKVLKEIEYNYYNQQP